MSIKVDSMRVGETQAFMGVSGGTKLAVFVRLDYDTIQENPLPDMGYGRIVSFSPRHCNYMNPEHLKGENNIDHAFSLSYYEHGLCRWYLIGEGPQCTFDTAQRAGAWFPSDATLESVLQMEDTLRFEDLRKAAQADCDMYTRWCNGSIYQYIAKCYELKMHSDGKPLLMESDYRFDDPVSQERCGGFYESDEAANDAEDYLANIDELTQEEIPPECVAPKKYVQMTLF